jgi:hypothetical protein
MHACMRGNSRFPNGTLVTHRLHWPILIDAWGTAQAAQSGTCWHRTTGVTENGLRVGWHLQQAVHRVPQTLRLFIAMALLQASSTAMIAALPCSASSMRRPAQTAARTPVAAPAALTQPQRTPRAQFGHRRSTVAQAANMADAGEMPHCYSSRCGSWRSVHAQRFMIDTASAVPFFGDISRTSVMLRWQTPRSELVLVSTSKHRVPRDSLSGCSTHMRGHDGVSLHVVAKLCGVHLMRLCSSVDR